MRATSGLARVLTQGRVRAIGDRRSLPQRKALMVCSRVSAQIRASPKFHGSRARAPPSLPLQAHRAQSNPLAERLLSPAARREYTPEKGIVTVSSHASETAPESLHARAACPNAGLSGDPNPISSPQVQREGAADLHRRLAEKPRPPDPTRHHAGCNPNPNSEPNPTCGSLPNALGKGRSEAPQGNAGWGGRESEEEGINFEWSTLNRNVDWPTEGDRGQTLSTQVPSPLGATDGDDGLTPSADPSVKDPKPKRERIYS